MADEKKQIEKFREAARDLECDDDDQRFNERLRKLVKHQKAGNSHPSGADEAIKDTK